MDKVEQEIVVNNMHGLHARPAALFVQIANKFDSAVHLEKDGDTVDGKSIIAVLSLGVTKGTKIKLILQGDDAREALVELRTFLEENNA